MKYLQKILPFAVGSVLANYFFNTHLKNKKKDKEHKFIFSSLIKSDKRIKKLLKLREIKKLEVKFKKHPQSEKFCDTPKRSIWSWGTARSGKKIWIPLDKNNLIIPYSKNQRLFNLAHEFGHIITKALYFTKCYKSPSDCLSKELQAHLGAQQLLGKINVRFTASFWKLRLLNKWLQCKKCLKIINKGKCPKKEQEKIKKCLKIIAQNIK